MLEYWHIACLNPLEKKEDDAEIVEHEVGGEAGERTDQKGGRG